MRAVPLYASKNHEPRKSLLGRAGACWRARVGDTRWQFRVYTEYKNGGGLYGVLRQQMILCSLIQSFVHS